MQSRKQKICLLFCGGSAIMTDQGVIDVRSAGDMRRWLAAVPELQLIADIEPVFVFGGDASEMEPALWVKLGREIYSRWNRFDGFVVTHGVDTMIYSAAMTSCIIQPHTKPIIFTGSPLYGGVTESGGQRLSGLISSYKTLGVKANLINAIQVATMDIGEVAIMFGNRLTRATETIKSDSASFNVFDASERGLLGKVDFGIKLFDRVHRRSRGKVRLYDNVEPRVSLLQLYPGAPASLLGAMVANGNKGIIIKTFNTNLFPESFKPVLKKAAVKKLPIVAHNQYALETKKKNREYILVNHLTFETTFVRFMWALGQTKDSNGIREIMVGNNDQ